MTTLDFSRAESTTPPLAKKQDSAGSDNVSEWYNIITTKPLIKFQNHALMPILILHRPFQPIHEEDNHSLAPSAPSYPSDWSAKPGKFRRISREKSRDRHPHRRYPLPRKPRNPDRNPGAQRLRGNWRAPRRRGRTRYR